MKVSSSSREIGVEREGASESITSGRTRDAVEEVVWRMNSVATKKANCRH